MRKAFSLIELMIVIVIIGALVSITLVSFDYSEATAESDSVNIEMYNIRKAFVSYYNDNFPSLEEDEAFHKAAKYGLRVLCESSLHNVLSADEDQYELAIADKDLKNNLGWNGPYIMQEGRQTVYIPTSNTLNAWQNNSLDTNTTGDSISIPVVQDPYGGYYRIVIPYGNINNTGNQYHPRYAFIVCTGKNGILQTFSDNFEDDEDEETYLQLVPELDSDNKDKTTGNYYDDTVLAIFPEYLN